VEKHTRSQGPSLHRHYPASTVILPCPTPADAAARSDVEAAARPPNGSPPITLPAFSNVPSPLPRRIERVRMSIASPHHAAFPKWQEGRHPHCHYRGLLRLHSRYGPADRSAAHT